MNINYSSNSDELITYEEAEKRGYLTLKFKIDHLEDEYGNVMIFSVGDKRIVVHNEKGLQETQKKKEVDNISNISSPSSCSLDDPECLSCGS